MKSINWFLTLQGFGSLGLLYSVTLFKFSLSFYIFVYFIESVYYIIPRSEKNSKLNPGPLMYPLRRLSRNSITICFRIFVWLPDYSIFPWVCDGHGSRRFIFVYYFIPRVLYSLWSIVHIQERQLNKLLKSKGKQNWSWVLKTGERTEISAGWGKDTR